MNTTEFTKAVNKIGLRVDIKPTGHKAHVRAFVFEPTKDMPLVYGRANIKNGEYVDMKWYEGGKPEYSLYPKHYKYYAWLYFERTRQILDRGVWINHILPEARRRAHEDYLAKKEWRDDHPKVDARGRLHQRKKLIGRSERSFGFDLINEMISNYREAH